MNDSDVRLKQFEYFEHQPHQPPWLFPLRKAGISHFAQMGFPTLRDEDWRFTNIASIAKLPFKPILAPSQNGITSQEIAEMPFGALPAARLVFVNGHFNAALSSSSSASASSSSASPKGLIITNLAAALANESSNLLEKHLARYVRGDENAFTALNNAFFQDGAFIFLPAGAQVASPIHLVFVATASEPGSTFHPRNLIIAEKGSQATILETYAGPGSPRPSDRPLPSDGIKGEGSGEWRGVDSAYFTNSVTELVLGDSARIEHCKFQDEKPHAFHMAAIHSHLGRSANLISHSIATGARLSRNNIRTSLAGEGVECVLNGLYLTHGDQLADHHMIVEHAQPHCTSHEYYNGILDGRSKGVFHGRILVRQAAQKTDAKQTNKNLLLSEEATADTKPQLEIYADDVKCTHGATVGQLNEESIFYLRSRGIGAERARRILIHAFAGEIIERIRLAPAREEMDKLVWEKLEQNPHVGEGD